MIEQGSNGGYIRLYRKLLENPVWTALPPAGLKVMLAFLLKANWKLGTWYDGNRQIEVPRGSFITSYARIADTCHLSVKQTRSAFGHLERLQFAAYTRAGKWTKVTILNYDVYQASSDEGGMVEGQLQAGSGQDEVRTRATIEEVNKGRKKKIHSPQPPEGGVSGRLFDAVDLSFGTDLSAHPEVRNGNGPSRTTAETIGHIAAEIHARHPHQRRDIGVAQVEKKLKAILRCRRVPPGEQVAFLERINRNHAAACNSEAWQKDGGQFAKGLENWLAPTKERYLNEPTTSAADHDEPPRMVL